MPDRAPASDDAAAAATETQFADFVAGDFDPVAYASKAIQGSDIATSLAHLSLGIDALNRQLQQQIIAHNDDLLRQVTGIDELDDVLGLARGGLDTLQQSMSRLHEKIRDPYSDIATRTLQLERLQEATELLRQLVRYLHLSRRLRTHLQGGAPDITKAAQCLNELGGLVRDRLLSTLSVVTTERTWIERAHEIVTSHADRMLQEGLNTTQNRGDVGTALQVFYNMEQLAPKVAQVMQGVHGALIVEIRKALDLRAVGSEADKDVPRSVGGLGGIRRVGEPTAAQTAMWAAALWQNLERLVDVLASHGQKVILLEQVLSRRRDAASHVSFLDEVLRASNSPGLVVGLWSFLAETLEKELGHAMKHSSFLQNTLQTEYPKLLRLFHLFFQRVQTIYNAVILTGGVQPGLIVGAGAAQAATDAASPLQVAMRKALGALETAYLSRSLSRMFDPINMAFPASTGGNTSVSKVPTKSDVAVIVKVVTSELDAAGFDLILLRAVIRNVAKAVKLFAVKSENTIDNQPGVYALTPSSVPSEVHVRNIDTLNALYILDDMLFKAISTASTSNPFMQRGDIGDMLEDALRSIQQLMQAIAQPLLQAVADVIDAQLAFVHREDFSSAAPAPAALTGAPDAPCSKYMKDTCATVQHLQQSFLSRIDCSGEMKHWMTTLTSYLVNTFLRHISIVRPLGDGGKLRMAADMAQFELGLAPLLASSSLALASIGQPYRALRAFRPLLFLDTAQAVARHHRRDLDVALVAHLLMVRASSDLLLPHTRLGWSPGEYVAWLDAHPPHEVHKLLLNNLTAYAADTTRRGEKHYTPEYPLLMRLLQEEQDAASPSP